MCLSVCVHSLIQKLVGKTRDVRDEAAGKDTSYYQSLLKAKNSVSSSLFVNKVFVSFMSTCRVCVRSR